MSTAQKNTNPEMGARARKRREALGLSKIQLAQSLNVGMSRLSQMELYGVESISMIQRWADALGLDPADLAFGEGSLTYSRPKPAKRTKKASK